MKEGNRSWLSKIKIMNPKEIAAISAIQYIESGMTIGLGTGSTMHWAINEIAKAVQEGLKIEAIPTSVQTEKLALSLGIPITSAAQINHIDIAIDGADEVDKDKNLIKGGGGALLREKIVACNSKQFIVIVDESKVVKQLGRFPLPVEVLPFGVELTLKRLSAICNKVIIRQTEGRNYITDNGNFIIDCYFELISDPLLLDLQIQMIPGVLETGLFLNTQVQSVIIGYKTGQVNVI